MTGTNRLAYIDNIRLIVIILVLIQHVSVTYSGFGNWYYMEAASLGIGQTIFFGFWQSMTQAFSMGLLFMIAGYFVPSSLEKKGFAKFISDRLIRLGVPALIYMLFINPLVILGLMGERLEGRIIWSSYSEYLAGWYFIEGSGPLWFALVLLVFSLLYALLKRFIPSSTAAEVKDRPLPTKLGFLLLMLLIATGAFLIRIVLPIGTSIQNMQLCYFSSYIVLFIIGVVSKQNDWFSKLHYAAGRRWLISAIVLGFVGFAIVMILGGALDGDLAPFYGGLTWQSAAYALWESFVAVSMSIGLLAVCKEKLNFQNRLARTMTKNAFSVYVFHPPIIVALTLVFAPIGLLPILKFLIMAIVGIPCCFLVTNFTIQKLPFVKQLFA